MNVVELRTIELEDPKNLCDDESVRSSESLRTFDRSAEVLINGNSCLSEDSKISSIANICKVEDCSMNYITTNEKTASRKHRRFIKQDILVVFGCILLATLWMSTYWSASFINNRKQIPPEGTLVVKNAFNASLRMSSNLCITNISKSIKVSPGSTVKSSPDATVYGFYEIAKCLG